MPLSRASFQARGFDIRKLNRFRWDAKISALRAHGEPIHKHLRFLLLDPEADNLTYDLANEDELVSWIAAAMGAGQDHVQRLLVEAKSNAWLNGKLYDATKGKWWMKTSPPLGRRLGWYVIARLLGPDRIVETGIHDGLGSLVLLAALDANGHGELVSFDIVPNAGWMVGQHPRWSARIESTTTGLAPAFREAPAQMFIHDSLHTEEHERFELETAASLMPSGVLISDNSHETTVLADLCAEQGHRYAFFQERPRDHFYRGGGIGLGVL